LDLEEAKAKLKDYLLKEKQIKMAFAIKKQQEQREKKKQFYQ